MAMVMSISKHMFQKLFCNTVTTYKWYVNGRKTRTKKTRNTVSFKNYTHTNFKSNNMIVGYWLKTNRSIFSQLLTNPTLARVVQCVPCRLHHILPIMHCDIFAIFVVESSSIEDVHELILFELHGRLERTCKEVIEPFETGLISNTLF